MKFVIRFGSNAKKTFWYIISLIKQTTRVHVQDRSKKMIDWLLHSFSVFLDRMAMYFAHNSHSVMEKEVPTVGYVVALTKFLLQLFHHLDSYYYCKSYLFDCNEDCFFLLICRTNSHLAVIVMFESYTCTCTFGL